MADYKYNAIFVVVNRFHLYKTMFGIFCLIQVYTMEHHLYLNDYIRLLQNRGLLGKK